METPRKRSRVSSYEDPSLGLDELRARNDLKLKSAFESIFQKYSQDFSGVGDEVDLETGEIVVNNGHLLGMRDEVDIGYDKDDETDELGDDLLSGLEQGELRGLYMEKSLDLRYEEQEQHIRNAGSKAVQPIMDGNDSLIGDVEGEDLLAWKETNTEAVVDEQLGSEPRYPRRSFGSIGSSAHHVSLNTTSLGSTRSNVDPAVSHSGVNYLDPYDTVVEPAWRATPLSIRSSGSVSRAVSTRSPYKNAIGRQRSSSPAGGSLWATGKTPGRPRKHSHGTRLPKLISNFGALVAGPPRGGLERTPNWLPTPSRSREALNPPALDTELDLNSDIACDVVDIKQKPLERLLVTPTKKSPARKAFKQLNPGLVQPSPQHSNNADTIVPRFSSPIQPEPNSSHRLSKGKRSVRQSKSSNAKEYSAKLDPKVIPLTPSRSWRLPGKSTKLRGAVSLTSMLGCDSDEDELCRPEKTVGSPNVGPVTTSLSSARKCGTPGFKCTRSICLRCA